MCARLRLAGLFLAGGLLLPAPAQDALRRPDPVPAARALPAGEFVRGEVLVKFAAAPAGPQPQAAGLLMPGARVLQTLGATGWRRVRLPEGLDAAAGAAWLRGRPGIAAAEPNARWRRHAATDDALLGRLWALEKIAATNVWATTAGSTNVVVAVFDTGVDHAHPDLAPNIWRNPGEIPGNGVDDDGNGFVDDVHGYDFVDDDGDPQDDHGHGTHVAGTIAAVGDNGIGIAGVAWGCRILAVRILSADVSATTADIVRAFDYVTALRKRGVPVRIINNSWGGGYPSTALNEALQAAAAAGILSVCSAGNDHEDNDAWPQYPAGYDSPGVLAVAASDACDEPASFSNRGPRTVHLTAPGVGILSLARGGARYAERSGTSMAAPHVAGAAALLLSARTNLSLAQLRAALVLGVDPLPQWQDLVLAGGRLNAARSLELALAAAPPTNLPAGPAPAAPFTLASRATGGRQATADSRLGSLSLDGRYLAFVSAATNLVAHDTNGVADVFLRDLAAGTTVRVSETPAGVGGNAESFECALSGDGRFVAFTTRASNLLPGDVNVAPDVLVWSRETRQLELANVRRRAAAAGLGSDSPDLSDDGRFVVFASDETGLVDGDANGLRDVFVRDRRDGRTEIISRGASGAQANGPCDAPVISGDGRWVAFHSPASTLMATANLGVYHVYLYDRQNRVHRRASAGEGGAEGDEDSVFARVSADGRYVAYQSLAANLAPGAPPGRIQTYVFDRQTGRTRRAGVRPDGAAIDDADVYVDGLSGDGRWVAFVTDSRQLAGPGFASFRPFLFDQLAGQPVAVAFNAAGHAADDNAFFSDVPGDGRRITFSSYASNLAPGDGNGALDVLVLDRGTNRADLAVRPAEGGAWRGLGLVGPNIPQRAEVTPGGAAGGLRLVNLGAAARAFTLRAAAPPAGWTATVRTAGGADVTAALLGAGWTSPVIQPGEGIELAAALAAAPSHPRGALRVEALAGADVLDAVLVAGRPLAPDGGGGYELVSAGADGAPAPRFAEAQGLSADGRLAVYGSEADTLVPADTNFTADIFLFDRTARTLDILSRTAAGQANGPSRYPAISRHGQSVVFQTWADNLGPVDDNDAEDVYHLHLPTRTFERASVSATGGELPRGSDLAAVSGDGRFVAFHTIAAAVPGDTNGCTDVYVRDRTLQTTFCVSRVPGGPFGNGDAALDAMTPDGRFLLFTTHADNLAPGDANGFADVFLYDRQENRLTLVSATPDGRTGNDASDGASLTDDGALVLFTTGATDIAPGTEGGVIVWDRATGRRRPLAERVGDKLGGRSIANARVLPGGRQFLLATTAGCDGPAATNRFAQIFRFDEAAGTLEPVSADLAGALGDGHSQGTAVAEDGRTLLFRSFSAGLLGEPNRGAAQIFAFRAAAGPAPDLAAARGADGPFRGAAGAAEPNRTELVWTGPGARTLHLRLAQHGPAAAPLLVRGPAAAEGLRLGYVFGTPGSNVPPAALAAGWSTPPLPPGQPQPLRVELERTGELPLQTTLEITGAAGRTFDVTRLVIWRDADADGIADAWELEHFGGLDVAAAGTDFDGDGASDAEEFQAGTRPKDAASRLRLAHAVTAGPALRLDWEAPGGRFVRLERSATAEGGFTAVREAPFFETGAQTHVAPLPAAGEGFFRVRAELP